MKEYIKAIYTIQKKEGRAHTGRIASTISVKPSSVTEMLHKLQKEGFVKYRSYTGVTLTPLGAKIAKGLLERHKIIADFLEILGIERKVAEIDACEIEHCISQETIDQLDILLKFIRHAPKEPIWLHHFRQFCMTGERLECSQYPIYKREKANQSDK